MQATHADLAASALQYARHGMKVFACQMRRKIPATHDGFLSATTDPARIARTWGNSGLKVPWNIGIATGAASGIVVIDFDRRHGSDASLEKLEQEYGALPSTVECQTPNGTHLYFRYPDGVAVGCRVGLRPGIDVRGDDGYVIAPPSQHPDGPLYEWRPAFEPWSIDLADLPLWLLTLITARPETKSIPKTPTPPAALPTASSLARGAGWLLKDARAYIEKANGVGEGQRNAVAFRLAGNVAAFNHNGEVLGEDQIATLMSEWNARNTPPLSDDELRRTVHSALHNGTPRAAKLVGHVSPAAASVPVVRKVLPSLKPCEVIDGNPELREVLVEGLLRRGEIMNIVAAPKTGKSHAVMDLAVSLAQGCVWLGEFRARACRVLLIDLELHLETLAKRLDRIITARCADRSIVDESLVIRPMRGVLTNIQSESDLFNDGDDFDVVIIDPIYKAWPSGFNENDNALVAGVYAQIDAYAATRGSAFVLVHHTSKGVQGTKSNVDRGSGAGAFSRAADTHISIIEHETPGAVILEFSCRSFKSPAPRVFQKKHPLLEPAPDLNPAQAAQPGKAKTATTMEDCEWFIETIMSDTPQLQETIFDRVRESGRSDRCAKALFARARDANQIFAWRFGRQKKYATVPQPTVPQST